MATLDDLVRSLLVLEVIRQRIAGFERPEEIDEGLGVVRAMAEQALAQVATLDPSHRHGIAIVAMQRQDLTGHLAALQTAARLDDALQAHLDATFAASTRLGNIARLRPDLTAAEAAEFLDALEATPR